MPAAAFRCSSSVAAQLGLTPAQASSSVFILWTSGAVASIALSLRLRQPIPITWTLRGLVYVGSLAGRFSVAEITAGALVAALILAALAAAGVGGRVMRGAPRGRLERGGPRRARPGQDAETLTSCS
jgi:predicted benzoate:H+ symporter BenE